MMLFSLSIRIAERDQLKSWQSRINCRVDVNILIVLGLYVKTTDKHGVQGHVDNNNFRLVGWGCSACPSGLQSGINFRSDLNILIVLGLCVKTTVTSWSSGCFFQVPMFSAMTSLDKSSMWEKGKRFSLLFEAFFVGSRQTIDPRQPGLLPRVWRPDGLAGCRK